MKIRRVGAEFFYVDRRTDMTKLLVAFRKFARAPKNCCFHKSPQANTRVLFESGRGHLSPNPPKFIIHCTILFLKLCIPLYCPIK